MASMTETASLIQQVGVVLLLLFIVWLIFGD
jgi:hypothetical protein